MQYEQPYGVADVNAPYVNGNPETGQQGSIPPAAAIENPQREIVAVIDSSDFTPTDSDLRQLLRSIRRQKLNFAIDSGTANNMVVTLDPPLEDYHQGFPLRVLALFNNSGATQINVNGLGLRDVKRSDGSSLQSGDIKAGMIANLVDTGTIYQLQNPLIGTPGTANTVLVDIPYIADTSGSANTITAIYSPAITSIAEGKFIAVKVAHTNTGATTIAVNALTAMPIYRDDGTPLQAGDILINEAILLENHSTYYQMLCLCRSQVLLPPAPKLRGLMLSQYGGAATAIPSSVLTLVSFPHVNKNSMVTSTWDGSRLTIGSGEGGIWAFYTCVHLAQIGVDCNFMSVSIVQNGQQVGTTSVGYIVAGTGASPSSANHIQVVPGDVIDFRLYQQSGQTNYTVADNLTSVTGFLISV